MYNSVLSSGFPSGDIIKLCVKDIKPFITCIIRLKKMTGVSMGIVIFVNFWREFAPSMVDDS